MSVDYVKANEDIVQESKDLVLSQFANSDNVQKLIEIIAEEAKSYEEIAEKVFTSFLLVNATGFTLDSIGEFFNFPRQDRSDDAYRTALVISAIGSNSKITRDSIYNLVEIATGGLGGLFYNGRYHDLYIYLQDACVEREIAAEFINKYLPANTQASVLFESGNSFGFEDNDNARGLSKVYQQSGEGAAYVEISYAAASDDIAPVLPRAFQFTGTNGYTYRTELEYSLSDRVAAVYWDIPTGYSSGDVISISARDNITRELFTDSLTIVNTGTARNEIATFLSDFFVDNNITTTDNVAEDTTSGHEIYIGFEEGLVAPIDGARVRGFISEFTIIVTAKNTSGLSVYSDVNVLNLTKGEIDGPWGLQLNPVDSPSNFTIISAQVGPEYNDGFGEEGLVIPEESFSEAGGFCTRASLTSRDILDFGAFASPEDLEYDLDSKLKDVVAIQGISGEFKQPRLADTYNKFTAQTWDNTIIGDSVGLVCKAPSGIEAFSTFVSNITDPVSELSDGDDLIASDIDFPEKPYYYEVDLEKLPNSPSIEIARFWNNVNRRTVFESVNTSGELIRSELTAVNYAVISCGYRSGTMDYSIDLFLSHFDNLKEYKVSDGSLVNEVTYSGSCDETLYTYSDGSVEDPRNIGLFYDPISRFYQVFIDGVEFNGTDGIPKYTTVGGDDDSGNIVGDVYVTTPYFENKGFFRMEFVVDNTEAEPVTEDDYGTLEFIYNRNELKYTSQLPPNTVDIFGRRITQEI